MCEVVCFVTCKMAEGNARARAWVFTVNNFTSDEYELLVSMPCVYMVLGREVGDQGVPHLQGYVVFKNQVYHRTLNSKLRCYWSVAKGDAESNFEYCSKEGDFEERGERPVGRAEARAKGGEATKLKWEQILSKTKIGLMDEVDAEVIIKHYSSLKNIEKDNMKPPSDLTDVTGIWFYGAAGCGKSYYAREKYPGAYLKNCNKWWDGYKQEENVIIDDFDKVHAVLGHHLKIWGDRYGFMPEVKCGLTKARPLNVVVTSNYHPRDVWDDNRTLEPILRRYRVVRFWKDDDGYHQQDEGRLMNGASVPCVPWFNLEVPSTKDASLVVDLESETALRFMSSSLLDILNS